MVSWGERCSSKRGLILSQLFGDIDIPSCSEGIDRIFVIIIARQKYSFFSQFLCNLVPLQCKSGYSERCDDLKCLITVHLQCHCMPLWSRQERRSVLYIYMSSRDAPLHGPSLKLAILFYSFRFSTIILILILIITKCIDPS